MMHHSPDELLRHAQGVYQLAVVAAKRAKELSEGAPKLVETEAKKVTTVALEEIRQGKVIQKLEEETKTAKPGRRRAKADKAEKKG